MMQASPSAPNEAVDKASSILLLSPTLELARAFLSGTSLAPSYSARLCRIMFPSVRGARMLVADSLVQPAGLFAHCGLPLPDGVPTTLSWADRARWSISNKYYEAKVDFVLRQVFAEVGTIAEDDVDDHTEGDEAEEAGYPAAVLLVSAAQLQVRLDIALPVLEAKPT